MEGMRHALNTAKKHDRLADVYRRIAQDRLETHLKTLDSMVDKMNYVHQVFEGFDTGKEVSLSYNIRVKIEKGEI